MGKAKCGGFPSFLFSFRYLSKYVVQKKNGNRKCLSAYYKPMARMSPKVLFSHLEIASFQPQKIFDYT